MGVHIGLEAPQVAEDDDRLAQPPPVLQRVPQRVGRGRPQGTRDGEVADRLVDSGRDERGQVGGQVEVDPEIRRVPLDGLLEQVDGQLEVAGGDNRPGEQCRAGGRQFARMGIRGQAAEGRELGLQVLGFERRADAVAIRVGVGGPGHPERPPPSLGGLPGLARRPPVQSSR